MSDDRDDGPADDAEDVLSWAAFADEGDAVPEVGDTSGGLEIDAGQHQEMRTIFLTTLPQYIDPVEQMMQELFSEHANEAADSQAALCSTLESLAAASSRIGFGDVGDLLSEMRALVAGLTEEQPFRKAAARRRLENLLDQIRDIATRGSGSPAGSSASRATETIVAALRRLDDFDDGILGNLTAAGLVTVDQLLTARPDEIVAVSGLAPDVVDRLLDALTPMRASAREAPDSNVVPLPIEGDGSPAQPVRSERDSSPSAASLQAMKVDVGAARTRARDLRQMLHSLQNERKKLTGELRGIEDRLSHSALRLGEVRAARDRAERDRHSAEKSLRREQERVVELKRKHRQVREDQDRIDRDVANLVEIVGNMLRRARAD